MRARPRLLHQRREGRTGRDVSDNEAHVDVAQGRGEAAVREAAQQVGALHLAAERAHDLRDAVPGHGDTVVIGAVAEAAHDVKIEVRPGVAADHKGSVPGQSVDRFQAQGAQGKRGCIPPL